PGIRPDFRTGMIRALLVAYQERTPSPPPKVLLVEDNADHVLILSTILTAGGFEVLHVGDGASGVDFARRHAPAAIIMDLAMPVMDGWDAIQRLRTDSATSHIPIIVLTAEGSAADRDRARALGCAEYLL